MADVYTVGIWTVKARREAQFVAAWRAMAEATVLEILGAHGTLLRNAEESSRFISFGPWASLEQVEALARIGGVPRGRAPRSVRFSTASRPAPRR